MRRRRFLGLLASLPAALSAPVFLGGAVEGDMPRCLHLRYQDVLLRKAYPARRVQSWAYSGSPFFALVRAPATSINQYGKVRIG